MRAAVDALDHLVLATPDLAGTVRWVAERTGVQASPGGQHVGRGSCNMLCSFGQTSYLEIVGPDPEQPDPVGPRPFGIDDLRHPEFVSWAVAVSGIEAAIEQARESGHDAGRATAMQRRRPDGVLLSWLLTAPLSIAIPFLIDWGPSPHPAATSAPGLRLTAFSARHPDPAAARRAFAALGVSVDVEMGNEGLIVRIDGPKGPLVGTGGGTRTLTSFDTGT